MTTRQSPRQTRKRLRQTTLTPGGSAQPASPGSEVKRRRGYGTESRGVWDVSAKGVMIYEPTIWKSDDYALLQKQTNLKIAAYDLDSTLISTKSRAKFPKAASDWKLLNSQVAPKLRALADQGYVFVIFTNQAGVGNGRITEDFVRTRVEGILSALDVDAGVFAATAKDHYRKPGTGMWDLFVQLIGGVAHIDAKNSFYIGDAAGRPARPGATKDFSDSDLRFSINIGLRFHTPEEHFLGRADEAVRADLISGFDPRTLVAQHEYPLIDETTDLDSILETMITPKTVADVLRAGFSNGAADKPARQTMVLMNGYPASGKTTFVKRHLTPRGYVWVNQDTQHTFSRCTRATKDALKEGKSVVIDNTNPDSDARRKYIEIAKNYNKNIVIVCLSMKTDQSVARHLNVIREWETQGSTPHIPVVAFHAYSKRMQRPSKDEQIDHVAQVDFIPRFGSEQERYLFTRLTV